MFDCVAGGGASKAVDPRELGDAVAALQKSAVSLVKLVSAAKPEGAPLSTADEVWALSVLFVECEYECLRLGVVVALAGLRSCHNLPSRSVTSLHVPSPHRNTALSFLSFPPPAVRLSGCSHMSSA